MLNYFHSTLMLLLLAHLLTGCSSLPLQTEKEFSNLYDHQWINTAKPHTHQDIDSVSKFLTDYDVVIFGEYHSHPAVHLAQTRLLQALSKLNPDRLSLSMEQFERDTQNTLDDYLDGKIGEKYLISKTRAWDNYPTSYRPLIEFAKLNKLPVIAANAPKKSVTCVGRQGLKHLDTLSDEERLFVAENIDISAGAYRDKFMSFLTNNSSHGSGADGEMSQMMKQMSERSYAAQVVRDDTMAESIHLHLQANPQRQVYHVTGAFHASDYLGTVERLANRNPDLRIAVINTVTVEKEENSWIPDQLDSGNFLLLVSDLPVSFVDDNNEQEWSKKILQTRMKSQQECGTSNLQDE